MGSYPKRNLKNWSLGSVVLSGLIAEWISSTVTNPSEPLLPGSFHNVLLDAGIHQPDIISGRRETVFSSSGKGQRRKRLLVSQLKTLPEELSFFFFEWDLISAVKQAFCKHSSAVGVREQSVRVYWRVREAGGGCAIQVDEYRNKALEFES